MRRLKLKVGDWIEFGYRRVWHISDPKDISSTKNIMCIVDGSCLSDSYDNISGIIVKYNKNSQHGIYLSDVIKKYRDKDGKREFQCGGGHFQYRKPYLRKIPLAELVLVR